MYYLFTALILLPTIVDHSEKKIIGLRLSFFFLFFLAAFQYVCSNDFWGYYGYWNRVLSGDYRDLEPLYCSLIEFFEPIGYFGWLIICAAFNMGVYYWLVKKHVKPQYYWLTIAIFALWNRCFLLMVNCNRQTLAVTFVSLMLVCMCWNFKSICSNSCGGSDHRIGGFSVKSLSLSVLFFFLAVNIHTSAFVAIILFPIAFLSSKEKLWNSRICIIVFVLIFLLRQLVDLSLIANYVKMYFLEQNSHFAYMTEQIARNNNISFFTELMYLSYIVLLGCFFKQLSLFERIVGLSFVFAVFIQPLFVRDMERLMMYFQVLFPVLAVILIDKIPREYNILRSYFVILVVLYGFNNFIIAHSQPMYHRWFDSFQLIFNQSWR